MDDAGHILAAVSGRLVYPEAVAMPGVSRSGQDHSKLDMILAVMGDHSGMPTPEVRAVVWERYEAEVTAQEIAQARKKLRQTPAPAGESAQVTPKEARMSSPKRWQKSDLAEAVESPVRENDGGGAAPVKKPARPKRSAAPVGEAKTSAPSTTVPAEFRAKDYAGAEVTVQQLSAILEVAEEIGGLRQLRESLRTVMLLREKAGDIHPDQLACALDFLTKLMGRP
jgi:hypothetical protein